MGGIRQPGTAVPDEQTLQAWEDIRVDLLHALQEGANAPDDLIELMGELAVTLKRGQPVQERPALRRRAA